MAEYIKLAIGDKIEQCFLLKSLKDSPRCIATFSNKTGEMNGKFSDTLNTSELHSLVGGAVKVVAIVKPEKDLVPYLYVKSIRKAEKGEYKSSELFNGLSEEKVQEYVGMIKTAIRQVKHPGYKALLEALLEDTALKRLSQMPASLDYYGKYRGGALAGAALITQMCKDVGVEYVTHTNQLHQGNIDWSLLLSGALLCTYGVINYLTPEAPFRKTPAGVDRGYTSVLQSMIERKVLVDQISLSEEELSRLLNVICCSISARTNVRATSKEGIILRHCLAMYAEIDMLDQALEETEEKEEGYTYIPSLKRYVAS